MIQFCHRRKIQFDQSDSFSRYCSQITDYCPFLAPSEANQVLFSSTYKLDGRNLDELQEAIFYIGVVEIERFRYHRSHLLKTKTLYCENVILNLSSHWSKLNGEALFGWPHYLLKLLYTQVGIMLGKFWIGEQLVSRRGKSVPNPPCHFLSIRSAIKRRDAAFLHKTEFLSPVMLASDDHGQNVHTLMPEGCQPDLIESMKRHQYYRRVLNWGKRKAE